MKRVHLVIAGSRDFPREVATRYLSQLDPAPIAEVVSGTARGPDTWGEEWANSVGVSVKRMPADWDRLGKRAGVERNQRMLDYVGGMGKGGLLAFWDGTSRGTKHVIDAARKMGLAVRVVYSDGSKS